MSSSSPRLPLALTDSPMSSASSPGPAHTDASLPSTIYDILRATDHPADFCVTRQPMETAGCRHLLKLKKQRSDATSGSVMDAYRLLVRYSLAWHKRAKQRSDDKKRKRGDEMPFPQCTTCLDPLSRLHVCLHCVYMGCWRKGHVRQHLKSARHTFAMDFERRVLYCNECSDYVYDAELTDTIVRQETLESELRVRRKRLRLMSSWQLTHAETQAIVQNSSLVSCRGIRGLCNMGNTCFMNVILQSLLHNPLLKAYFLSDQHNPSRCANKFCLCCEMDKLFSQIYSGNSDPYGPCSFLQSMWMSLKELAGYAQQDAHEFFISALNNIHASCEDHTLANCKCIVHKTFAGLLQSNVTCLRCGNVTTTCDPMLDISLGLRPSEKRKKASQGHPQSTTPAKLGGSAAAASGSSRPTGESSEPKTHDAGPAGTAIARRTRQGNTLADCLDRYTHPETLGPNEYSCSKCGNTFQEATKQLAVKRLPPVLSFQLKRFEHGGSATKIETKIRFPVELDMTPYTTQGKGKTKARPSNMYTLFAVVNHQGRMDTGHYTMFAKHRGEWFKFDDHTVTKSYQKDVLDSKA